MLHGVPAADLETEDYYVKRLKRKDKIMAKTIKMQKVVKAIKVAYNGVTNEEARELVPVFIRKAA